LVAVLLGGSAVTPLRATVIGIFAVVSFGPRINYCVVIAVLFPRSAETGFRATLTLAISI